MEVRCLEWFSGIGGLHYGLLEAQKRISESSTINSQGEKLEVSVVAAFDINELANRTYEHNFQKAPITVNLLSFFVPLNFSMKFLEKY